MLVQNLRFFFPFFERFGSKSLFSTYWTVVIEDDTRRAVAKTPLGNIVVSTAWQISRGPATSSTTGVWNVLCHMSRAEVMREWDIHHTRSIKTNSAVNLSRKPGLDLCCDLLQHLQRVPCTCSFWVFTSCTYIDFVRLITQILFHVKCYHIIFSYYMDGSFRSILLCFTVKQQYHAYLTPPSMRVI